MNHNTTKALIILSLFILGACSARERADKNLGEDSDRMKISPCACAKLDYEPQTYNWRS